MGTWDNGLLDNDTALDGLGDLQHGIVEDIVGADSAERLAAALGVLLQLSPYEFGLDTPSGPRIVVAAKHRHVRELSSPARGIVEAIAAGGGSGLAERPDESLSDDVARWLSAGGNRPFGKREPALFASAAAAAYVQEVAERCVEAVGADFEDEANWSDLCREGMGMAMLGVLLILEPCTVPRATLESWRRNAKQGLATLEEQGDEELSFHRGYYANVDRVLARLLERYG